MLKYRMHEKCCFSTTSSQESCPAFTHEDALSSFYDVFIKCFLVTSAIFSTIFISVPSLTFHSLTFVHFLSIISLFLQPMKALKAAAGTSQPVLSTKQVQTVFYQIPELRDLHKDFFTSLRARLQPDEVMDPGAQQGLERVEAPLMQLLSVGDLFLKFVSCFICKPVAGYAMKFIMSYNN